MSQVCDRHDALFGFLLTVLNAYTSERDGAAVRGPRYVAQLPSGTVTPEIMVVLAAHRAEMSERRLEGNPDFIIEIARRGDDPMETAELVRRYREARVAEIWWIDPYEQFLRADRRSFHGYDASIIRSGRVLSTVLLDFWIDAAWLWADSLPRPLACVREILS